MGQVDTSRSRAAKARASPIGTSESFVPWTTMNGGATGSDPVERRGTREGCRVVRELAFEHESLDEAAHPVGADAAEAAGEVVGPVEGDAGRD